MAPVQALAGEWACAIGGHGRQALANDCFWPIADIRGHPRVPAVRSPRPLPTQSGH